MKIIYGMYKPDEGEIYVRGKKVNISSPKDAISLGIGMVHQHFTLVPSMTVLENVVLGCKTKKSPLLDLKSAKKRLINLSKKFGLTVDPYKKVEELSVAHDHHNVVVVGADEVSMSTAANAVISAGGGLSVAVGDNVQGLIELPICGLMSLEPLSSLKNKLEDLHELVSQLGGKLEAPFMALSFVTLSAIPWYAITDKGLVDVESFSIVDPVLGAAG